MAAEVAMLVSKAVAKAGAAANSVEAAVLVQAAMRGHKERSDLAEHAASVRLRNASTPLPKTDIAKAPVSPDDAALRVQAVVRGHKARSDLEEHRRSEWMRYYTDPTVADFEAAFQLCVTEEDFRMVESAKLQAASPTTSATRSNVSRQSIADLGV